MKRIQLYLDDELWAVLHMLARRQRTSISHLLGQAVRDRYLGNFDGRRAAMQTFVGRRKNRPVLPNSEEYVRSLRRGSRLERLNKK